MLECVLVPSTLFMSPWWRTVAGLYGMVVMHLGIAAAMSAHVGFAFLTVLPSYALGFHSATPDASTGAASNSSMLDNSLALWSVGWWCAATVGFLPSVVALARGSPSLPEAWPWSPISLFMWNGKQATVLQHLLMTEDTRVVLSATRTPPAVGCSVIPHGFVGAAAAATEAAKQSASSGALLHRRDSSGSSSAGRGRSGGGGGGRSSGGGGDDSSSSGSMNSSRSINSSSSGSSSSSSSNATTLVVHDAVLRVIGFTLIQGDLLRHAPSSKTGEWDIATFVLRLQQWLQAEERLVEAHTGLLLVAAYFVRVDDANRVTEVMLPAAPVPSKSSKGD